MRSFPYEGKHKELFELDRGHQTLKDVSEFVANHAEQFSAQQVVDSVVTKRTIADAWMVLNALDYFVTLGRLRELTAGKNVQGQDRRYDASGT